MQILIVKLTSMGDLIHALPAVSDAIRAIPNLEIDWVVDEAFAEIPRMHPGVKQIITTAHRRWQRQKWNTLKNKELVHLWQGVRQKKYDIVIDAQNNLKSALVTSLTRGHRCGMDKNSVREKFAHFVCDQTFHIPVQQHAIVRQRQLFAYALNYSVPDIFPDFGISLADLPEVPLTLPIPYLVFVHSTTWESKHWLEAYWRDLLKRAETEGYYVVLPWGNQHERARAERLAIGFPKVLVLPRLTLMQQAAVIAGAKGAICVDTGLGHLTAALNKPAVHLYGSTDPALIGATGRHQTHLSASYECAPCYLHQCKWGRESACFVKDMSPDRVWNSFKSLI